MSVYVRIEDVRALLRLVGEGREMLDAGACPRLHVLTGLTRLAGAAVGVLFEGRFREGAPEVTDYLDHGWTAGESQRVVAYYGARPATDDPLLRGVMRAHPREPHVTVRRADVVTSAAWYASELHDELHRPGRLDDVIFSCRFIGRANDGISALVLKRAAGDRPFSVEERDLLHMFRSESDWLFRSRSKAPREIAEGLTRREQETLDLLLTDASEKLVAARLGISPHTAHDHVKKLYRKLGVTSRAALMALALSPDRGGGPPPAGPRAA